jgi:catechol 2,3-dioxygenase-like lactoylglutathione lyase family enzyme
MPKIAYTPVYCTDLDAAHRFYTEQLGFETREDVDLGQMRWLSVAAPGSDTAILLAAVDQHLHDDTSREAMRTLLASGQLPVFLRVDDVDAVFEQLRAGGAEILQEPVDQPYGMRDAAVRDPSGNHLRIATVHAVAG